MLPLDLSGKRAIVCGATKGIGRAVAEELAEQGASLCIVGRNRGGLDETLAALSTRARQSHDSVCADFADPQDVRARIEAYLKTCGAVQILVNNTGGPAPGPLVDATSEDLHKAFSSHLLCNHHLAQCVVPAMRELGWGRIVNIVSTSVREPLPGLGVSNTTRGAVASWAKTLALELGPFGITVNNVLPGPTETDRLRAIIERKAQDHGRSFEAERQAMEASLPLRRLGHPREVAYAVCFLASEAAAFITGVSLAVDGGRMHCI